MMKKRGWFYPVYGFLFLALVLVPGISGPFAAEEIKIGYVDTQRVLDESTLGKKVKDDISAHVKSRQQIIDLEEGELKKFQDELSRQGAVLSDQVRAEKEEAFQKKFGEYQQKVAELQREIQSKKMEKLKDFNDHLVTIAKKIAESEGLSLIFANDLESGSILYAKPSMNMTDRVIQELNKTLKESPEEKK
jgi:outer membrane protein